jgi:dihydroflavonol-4-reductase
LYHVAAVFKHWAKDPKKEILEANLTGTRNVLETAAVCGINKIIYVGSIAALDFSADIVDETTWGKAFPTMYFKSKNDSEKLAWHLAEKLSLPMITVLPSGMIGPEITKHLTPAMELLYKIVRNKLIFDPRFEINYVHVRDVAAGMILAEKYGRPGERYILGNEYSLSTTEVIKIANKLYPTIRIPRKVSKNVQLLIATAMEVFSKYTGNPPLLLRSNVKHYYKKKENLNILKARNDLGYNPMKPEEAVKEALESFYKQL